MPTRASSTRFDERSLVESARQDPNAFAQLYRRYVDRIYGYAFRRSGSVAIAEDVTSATFEKALAGLSSYKWREPGIGPWLFRIASNELVNVYRSDARQERAAESVAVESQTSGSDVGNDPAEAAVLHADNDADTAALLAALSTIRPRYQRALTLRYFAELSNEDAAAAMGVTRATMAVIVHRGVVALRKAIESASSPPAGAPASGQNRRTSTS